MKKKNTCIVISEEHEILHRISRYSCYLINKFFIQGGSFDKDTTLSGTSAEMTNRSDPEASIRRLLIMTYFPSGFWSRLITRILGDDSIIEIVRCFFIIPKEVNFYVFDLGNDVDFV